MKVKRNVNKLKLNKKPNIVESLIELLISGNSQIKTYSLGTLYLILSRKSLKEKAIVI